jgi:two-component system response regulator LytT
MEKKYRCLIVDDDPASIEHLKLFLEQTNLFETPHTSSTILTATVILSSQSIDLVFLDIELGDMSGLELLKLFPQHPPVIAISSHPKYAADCYDWDIQDFISKPLTYTRLLRGLRRTILNSHYTMHPMVEPKATPYLPTLPTLPVAPVHTLPTSIYLKTGRKVERFVLNEILYVEAYTIYTKLINKSGIFVINEKLSTLENQFGLPLFIRVHKSYLINLEKVTQFNSNTIWIDSHKVPIGKTYKDKVQERLKSCSIY